jgi:polar amino acid transport system permease protein
MISYTGLILKGALVTIQLTAMGFSLAIVVAFITGLCRLSRWRLLRAISLTYLEFFRGTSLFVQLFWVYFVLPLFGIPLTAMQAGVMALGLNVGAYGSEVVRGAILSIPKEQTESCIALNLTAWQTMRYVILPQAFVIMLPSLSNNAIELLKATSIVSLIAISDMTFQAQVVRAQTGNTAIPFLLILSIYYVMSTLITFGFRALERKRSEGLDVTKA